MSFKKNYFYSVLYQIMLTIIPFITTPYLARVLGASGVGIYAYNLATVSYFVMFGKLGYSNFGTRKIAQVREDRACLVQTFWDIYCSQITCFLIAGIGYFSYCFLFPIENKRVALCFGLLVISGLFDIDWFFFGIEKFKLTILRNTIVKIATTIAIFLFVKSPEHVWIFAIVYSFGTLLSTMVLWMGIKNYISFAKPNLKEIPKLIGQSSVLFVPILAMSVYRTFDKIMLGNMSNIEEVGYYENAEKVIYLLLGFVAALGRIMMPRMANLEVSQKAEEGRKTIRKSMRFIMLLTSIFSFGIAGIADTFVPLFFGEDFLATAVLMKYLAITIMVIAWANVIRTQYIIPKSKDIINIISLSTGAIINLVLNFILIPQMGALGAVIGTIFAEVSVVLVQCIFVKKDLEIIGYLKDSILFVIFGLCMFIVVSQIGKHSSWGWITLGLQILAGAVVYIGLLFAILRKDIKQLINL